MKIKIDKKTIRDQMLICQTGGEEVRMGMIWNKNVVLDIFSKHGGNISIQFTPMSQYIQEEFINYGCDGIDEIICKVGKSKNITVDKPRIIKTNKNSPYNKIIELDTGHIVEVFSDDIEVLYKR